MSASAVAPETQERWAGEPYPDYVAQVNRSIAFSGVNQDFFTLGKARHLVEVLRRRGFDPLSTRLLDIGCGVGLIHKHLTAMLGTIHGIDVALDALHAAQLANPGATYEAYDGRRLPVADGSFDAAMTICVMHHVPPKQWLDFVADALRALKPGGLFVVFEHNPWNPLTRLAVARCPFDFDAVLLSPPKLAGLMREAGFAEVAREFLFFTPFKGEGVVAAEARLRWLPLGAQYAAVGHKPG
jgi:SAM-dependent methyltransferase